MSISARNLFKGTVSAITGGPLNAEVEITTAGGDKIVAMLTETSVQSLGLEVGTAAVAVVKATWVTLLTHTPGYRFSARNQLHGKVNGLQKSGASCEVKVLLPGGSVVYAMVTSDAADAMGLTIGVQLTAMFKASHVLLGVPG